jgi:hypothetical protein
MNKTISFNEVRSSLTRGHNGSTLHVVIQGMTKV